MSPRARGRTPVGPSSSVPLLGVLFAGPRFLADRQFRAGIIAGAARRGLSTVALGGGMLDDDRGFAATGNRLFDLARGGAFDALVAWGGEMAVHAGARRVEEYLGRFSGMPVVCVAHRAPGLPCVTGDDFEGMLKVVGHLLDEHGARRLAFVKGPEGHPESDARFRAFVSALESRGLAVDERLVCTGRLDEASGRASVAELLDARKVGFDAVVAAGDAPALGALAELRDRGLRVPGDVLVTGFDDRADAPCSEPPLTTVRYSFARMAEAAVDAAADMLEGRRAPDLTLLNMDLVVRRSCGCLPSGVRAAVDPGFGDARGLGPSDAAWRARVSSAWEAAGRDGGDRKALAAFLQVFELPWDGEGHAGPGESNAARQDFVSALERGGSPSPASGTVAAGAARIDAAGMAVRRFERSLLESEREADALAATMDQAGVELDLGQLSEALYRGLPALGLRRFALCLYCGPDEAPMSRARFLVGWTESGRLAREGLEFDAALMAPPGLLPADRFDLLAMPLYFRDESLGFVLLDGEGARIGEALRTQLSRAVKASMLLSERERARNQLASAFNRLGLIRRLGALVAETTDLDALLASGARLIREEFGLYAVFVFLSDSREGSGQVLRLGAASAPEGLKTPAYGFVIQPGQRSIVGASAQACEAVVVPDVSLDPRFLPTPELPDTLSEAALPLVVGQETVGVLDLESDRLDAFDADSMSAIASIAAYFANAIRNAALLAEARAARAQAEEANRLKSKFLAGMSHELRTPLNSIINFSYLIGLGTDGPLTPDQADLIARIEASGQHLLGLINDLLDLAKIESGRMELFIEGLDPWQLVESVASVGRGLVRDKPVRIVVDAGPGLPRIQGDRTRLKQVLLNLVSNAAKYTDSGTITMRARREGPRFVFSVSDTGAGMDPADVPHIFSEFAQAGNLSDRRPGTGLGLSLSLRFSEMHGGGIRVETAKGLGSTFFVDLPIDGPPDGPGITRAPTESAAGSSSPTHGTTHREAAPSPAADRRDGATPEPVGAEPVGAAADTEPGESAEPAVDGADGTGRPVRVLVIDDDEGARRTVAAQLASSYEVECLADPRAAVARARAFEPDVVLLDLLMPGKDGWSVLNGLLSDEATKGIPVLISSAYHGVIPDNIPGAAGFVHKPVDPTALREAVRSVAPAGGRVLAVDDDRNALAVVSRLLSGRRYEVDAASGGEEGLAKAAVRPPDAILLDLMMDGLDGMETLERLRADGRTANVPVIVMSARDPTPAEDALLRERGVRFVRKGSYDAGELRRLILSAMRSRDD